MYNGGSGAMHCACAKTQRSYIAMNESIFQRKNQDIVDLFKSAKHPKKVACVALDYAKGTHIALICNGEGKRFKAQSGL